jgi:hypothetical protein
MTMMIMGHEFKRGLSGRGRGGKEWILTGKRIKIAACVYLKTA